MAGSSVRSMVDELVGMKVGMLVLEKAAN